MNSGVARPAGADAFPALVLAVTLVIQVLVSMCVLALPAIAPAVAKATGRPLALLGVYIALLFGGAMVAAAIGGAQVRRHGPVRVSQACLVLCSLGVAAVASGAAPLMALGAALIGFGYGPITPASSQLLAAVTPPRLRGLVFSLKQTGVPIGGVLAGALLPGMLELSNWRLALLAVALVCAVAAVATQRVRGHFDREAPATPTPAHQRRHPVALVWGNHGIRPLAILSMFFASMQMCFSAFFVAQLHLAAGLSLVRAGMLLALGQGAGVVGRITWGFLTDHGVRPARLLGLLALVMGGSALACALLGPRWSLGAMAVLAIAFGATATGWNGVYLAEVARLSPAGQAGALTGGTLTFTYAGIVVGPPLFSLVATLGGALAWGYGFIGSVLLLLGVSTLARAVRAQAAAP